MNIENITEEKTEHTSVETVKKAFRKEYAVGAAIVLVLLYLIGALYYNTHFFSDTYINNIPCENLTVEEAEQKIAKAVIGYSYTVKVSDKEEEKIKGSDIDLVCSKVAGIKEAKEKQNPFAWMFDTSNRDLKADLDISYNEDKLFYQMEWLSCVVESRETITAIPSRIAYENGVYHVSGNDNDRVIDFGRFFSEARLDVYELENEISLEDEGLYISGNDSKEAKNAIDEMNKYVSSSITYTRGEEKYILSGDTICMWVSIGDDYSVTLDESKIAEYIKHLAVSYDTVGTQRNFVTSKGETISIGGGNYGWRVNQKAEADALAELIRNGQTTTREPIYAQTAAAHGNGCDIYNTYVEISLASQHLWFYKDGELIVETPVVTGNPYAGNATPPGIFHLAYKMRNTVLRGANYASPVSYWMPFNGGVGLHDATWRGVFGGSIYRGGGSHGCVNMPLSAAGKVYESISRGDPIIVY